MICLGVYSQAKAWMIRYRLVTTMLPRFRLYKGKHRRYGMLQTTSLSVGADPIIISKLTLYHQLSTLLCTIFSGTDYRLIENDFQSEENVFPHKNDNHHFSLHVETPCGVWCIYASRDKNIVVAIFSRSYVFEFVFSKAAGGLFEAGGN